MDISEQLRELMGSATQTATARRLRECGLERADQALISAWLNGRRVELEEVAIIERCFGMPRGWMLVRAGWVDLPALLGAPISDKEVKYEATLRATRDLLRDLTGLLDREADL